MEHNMRSSSYINRHILDEIALADGRIAATLKRIADQEQRIARNGAKGEDTASSWKLRNIFLSVLETHERHRAWLLNHLP